MPIQPEEIMRKRFLITMRGYDRAEVDAYMRTLASEQTRLLTRIRDLEDSLQTATGEAPLRSEGDDELAALLDGAARRIAKRRRFRAAGPQPA